MRSNLPDFAESLKRRFSEASARWPNLASVLILWTGTSDELASKSPDSFSQDDERQRFRDGYNGKIARVWRRVETTPDSGSALAKHEANLNFQRLADSGARLVDGLSGLGLSENSLSWISRHTAIGWQLVVHDIAKPAQQKLPSGEICELIDDIWLESVTTIMKLMAIEPSGRRRVIPKHRICGECGEAGTVRKTQRMGQLKTQHLKCPNGHRWSHIVETWK